MCWSECYFNKVKCEQKKNQIVKLKFFFSETFQKPEFSGEPVMQVQG